MTLVANITVDITEAFDSIMQVAEPTSNQGVAILKSFIPGRNAGGGILTWDATMDRSQHNGITILSPSAAWDGTYEGLPAYRASGKVGTGCWVRQYDTCIMASWAGVDTTGVWIMDEPMRAAAILAWQLNKDLRVDAGTIKAGFSSKVQYHDKFNLYLDTSVILDNLSNLRIFAENDVEINTYGTGPERVVFFLQNCTNCTVEGFNWNSFFTNYSTQPSDSAHRIEEHWKGFVIEGGTKLTISKQRVNAAQVFVLSDVTNLGNYNGEVYVLDCTFKYVVNYCIISRKTDYVCFDRNDVSYNGRAWHTYGEAVAPTTNTRSIRVCDNHFTDQIAVQSCITPGPHIENGLISGNYCKRRNGIFIENGSTSNLIISNNVSISVGERLTSGSTYGTTHILLVGGVDDQPIGNSPHSNILIQGNRFEGGGYAIQEYNTGIALRTGFQIKDNQMINCIPPIITNQSFIGIEITGNLIKAPDDFPDLTIAGQYPVIDNNILIGVRVRARDLGYTIIAPKITNNVFRANSVGSVFPALIDFTDFNNMVAEGNNATAAAYTDFIVNPLYATSVGFKRVGVVEGFTVSPYERFGSKLTCTAGDIVMNREPAPTNNKYAWVCVDTATKQFGSITIAI